MRGVLISSRELIYMLAINQMMSSLQIINYISKREMNTGLKKRMTLHIAARLGMATKNMNIGNGKTGMNAVRWMMPAKTQKVDCEVK